GKRIQKKNKHFFIFRRIISCRRCKNLLIAERQKENIYYRCQTKQCPQKTIREEIIEEKLLEIYEKLQLTSEEFNYFKIEAINYLKNEPKRNEEIKKHLLMEFSQIESRLAKLTDAYMDEIFDKETYFAK